MQSGPAEREKAATGEVKRHRRLSGRKKAQRKTKEEEGSENQSLTKARAGGVRRSRAEEANKTKYRLGGEGKGGGEG